MKKSAKIVLIVLAAIIVFTVLFAVIFKDLIIAGIVSILDGIIDGDKGSTAITRSEFSMETTEKFEYDFYAGYSDEHVFVSDDHLIGVYRVNIDELHNEDQAAPSLETYASLFFPLYYGLRELESIPLNNIDGLLCYEADFNKNEETDTFVFFFESEEAYWFVRMTYNKDTTTYEDSRDLFISWAKTIKFTEKEESVDAQ